MVNPGWYLFREDATYYLRHPMHGNDGLRCNDVAAAIIDMCGKHTLAQMVSMLNEKLTNAPPAAEIEREVRAVLDLFNEKSVVQ